MLKIFGVGNSNIKTLKTGADNRTFDDEDDTGQIALDIVETPKEIVIFAPIAGVELEDIDLTLNKSVLTIKGEREKPVSYFDEDNTLRNLECYWGRFVRNIILPENLDFDMVKAVMENNLLKVSIPKLHISSQNIKINRIGENFNS